jgi:hypothetical protein
MILFGAFKECKGTRFPGFQSDLDEAMSFAFYQECTRTRDVPTDALAVLLVVRPTRMTAMAFLPLVFIDRWRGTPRENPKACQDIH